MWQLIDAVATASDAQFGSIGDGEPPELLLPDDAPSLRAQLRRHLALLLPEWAGDDVADAQAQLSARSRRQRPAGGDAVSLHGRFGVAVIVVSVVGVALVLLARFRPSNIPTVRVFVRLCAAAAAVEAVIGIVLVVAGHRPTETIHFFYGAATVIPIPAAELLARRVQPRGGDDVPARRRRRHRALRVARGDHRQHVSSGERPERRPR